MSKRESKSKSSASKHCIYDPSAVFDSNSTRPPVPGKESTHCVSDWGPPQMDGGQHKSSSSIDSASCCGNEPEGSCRSNSRPSSRHDKPNCSGLRTPSGDDLSPPACLQWAHSLHFLLQDPKGVNLFMQFLDSEGPQHAGALHFWFACEGLKNQMDREKIQRLVKVIYNTFLVKSALPINAELLREIALNLKSPQCICLLEEAQAQIEYLINNTTYPNFLKSDMYLQHLQSVQNPNSSSSGDFSCDSSSSSSSSASAKELTNLASGLGSLPTLHEDVEFTYNPPVQHMHTSGTGSVSTGYLTPTVNGPVRLTKDMLLMSQKHRVLDVRPKMEAFAGVFVNRGVGAHAAYNSYNPVSRQDSELQSLSSHSDARTESDMSGDGKSVSRNSHCRAVLEARLAREYAALNRETDLNQTMIPRTQRMDKKQQTWMDLSQHAAILTEKLESLKRDQEKSDLLDKKLKEGDMVSVADDKGRMSDVQARELANAIREKLQLEDDNDQDILDQHVSRVFSPAVQSPGVVSPRPHSPARNRYLQSSYTRSRRKEKDGFSMLSSDSGNIYDFSEGSEHRLSMVKSKSMPEYPDERFSRGSGSRRSTSKKTLTDLTDSGVSVLSDTPPISRTWLMDADKCGRLGMNFALNEMIMKHRGHRTSSATSPNASRHRKGYGSRSSSLERGTASGSLGPTQPFVADPSLPPPPRPNPDVQLEEARKRLMEDDFRSKPRQRLSSKYHQDMSLSSQSTLRKSTRGQRPIPVQPSQNLEEYTTVIFSFCDEQFPYRSKIPGTHITLRQFKEYLPKKGNYRFFFKTVSEELDNQVIQEEVSNDSDIIPLWEGKIMAQVKPLD